MKVEREWSGVKKDKERFFKNRIFLLAKSERDFACDPMNFEEFCLLFFLGGQPKTLALVLGEGSYSCVGYGLWKGKDQGQVRWKLQKRAPV